MNNPHSLRLAVILAAGLGSRIATQSAHHPKGFISVGGQTLIERSLKILRFCGFKKIVICTGHLSKWYEELCSDWPEIECVKNEAFKETGSLNSLILLQEKIEEDFLLLESDLLYEKRAVTVLNELPHEAILLSGTTNAGDEVFVEEDKEHCLVKVSKNSTDIHRSAGEFVGINRLSLGTYTALCEWVARNPAERTRLHYEEGLSALYPLRKLPLLQIPDLLWTEIDMESQWVRAEREIFPKLKGDTL